MDSQRVSRFPVKTLRCICIQMVPRGALLRPPEVFFVPEKTKKCTCFCNGSHSSSEAARSAEIYLWRLRSAMAESSRGKLVRLFFFFKTASVTRRHAHTRPASHPESLQVCVCELLHLRGLPVFVFIYTYTVFIYIFVWLCLSLVCGDLGERSKWFWIEDNGTCRRQEKKKKHTRGAWGARGGRGGGRARGRWGQAAAPRKMRRKAAELERKGWRREREKRGGFNLRILIQKQSRIHFLSLVCSQV